MSCPRCDIEQVGVVEAFADHCARQMLAGPAASPPTSAKAFQVRGQACSAHSPEPSSTRPPARTIPAPVRSPRNIDPTRSGRRSGRHAADRRAGWLRGGRGSTRAWIPPHGRSSTPRVQLEIVQTERRSGVRCRELRVRVAPQALGEDARACSSTDSRHRSSGVCP